MRSFMVLKGAGDLDYICATFCVIKYENYSDYMLRLEIMWE